MVLTVQRLLGAVQLAQLDDSHQLLVINDIISLTDNQTCLFLVLHQTLFGEVGRIIIFYLRGIRPHITMEYGIIPLRKAARLISDFSSGDNVVHEVVHAVIVHQFGCDAVCMFRKGTMFRLSLLMPAYYHTYILAVLHQVDAYSLLLSVHDSHRLGGGSVKKRVSQHRYVVAAGQGKQ